MLNLNFIKKLTSDVNLPEIELGKDDPLVQLSQVSKIYPPGTKALKEINARFFPGEFVGIMGKSGAGKTTLINVLSGLDHLSSGEVQLNGLTINNLTENQMAIWRGRNLGIVYQTNRLMPTLTLLDNIMLPIDLCGRYHPQESRELAMQLLRAVELEEHAYKLPSAISGGQQQRVAIARALANDPPIIVADEPTGRLDSATSEVIYDIFEDLTRKGKLIIMVSHDLTVSDRLSRRIDLVDGEISFDSHPA
jgi:putative ABC transport system ATP-binding protein